MSLQEKKLIQALELDNARAALKDKNKQAAKNMILSMQLLLANRPRN